MTAANEADTSQWKDFYSADTILAPHVTATIATVPGAPTGVAAIAGNGQANVSWTAPASNGGSPITGYTVTSSPGALTGVPIPATATSATVSGLKNGTAYNFYVTATTAAGTSNGSTVSNTVTPAGKPLAPTAVTATGGDGQANVTWTAPSSNGATITGYTVTSTPDSKIGTSSGTTTSAPVAGLTNGTSYTFTVTATNSVGTSGASLASNAVTPAGQPGPPTGVQAASGDGQATVTWTAPASNGGASLTGYTVTSTPGGRTATSSGSTTTANVTGLTNGTAYTFTATATNAALYRSAESVASNRVTATKTPANPPAPPTAVTATASGTGQAAVSWVAPASNGGSALTGYTITTVPATSPVYSSSTATSSTVNGLKAGVSYRFGVTAANSVGATGSSLSPALTIAPITPTGGALGTASIADLAGAGDAVSRAGSAATAGFNAPGATVYASGAVYTASTDTIMRTDATTGTTTVLAGTPGSPSCTDGTTGASAGVYDVEGITSDGTSLYTVGACGVRSVDLSTGAIHAIDVGGVPPYSISNLYSAVTLATSGGQSWLFATDNWHAQIDKINLETGATTVFYAYTEVPCCGARSLVLSGITADSQNLFVPMDNGYVNVVTSVSLADGSRGTMAIPTDSGRVMSVGGYLYAVAYADGCAGSCQDRGSHIAQISKADGSTTWIAGAGVGYRNGTGSQAWFGSITGLATDGTRLFIADGAANRLRIAATATPLASNESPSDNNAIPVPYGTAATLTGNTTNATVPGVGTAASFADPSGLTIIGNTAYISGSDAVSKLNLANGTVSVLAGQPGTPGDTDALTGTDSRVSVTSLTNDGTYLYFSQGQEIRRTDPTSGATSLLTGFGLNGGLLTFGADGELYQGGYSTVRRFDPVTGAFTTAWDLPVGGSGFLDDLRGIAADASGLWVAYSEEGPGASSEVIVTHLSYDGSVIATLTVDPHRYGGPLGFVSAGDSLYVGSSPENGDSSRAASVLYRVVKQTGLVVPVAGGSIVTPTDIDGVGTLAGFAPMHAIASDGVNLYTIDDHLLRAIIATPEPDPTPTKAATIVELIGGGDPSSLQQCPCKADPVQLNSGALIESGTDLSISGRGPGLKFTRSYDSSQAASNGRLGYGWTDNLDMALTVDSGAGPTAGQVTIRQEKRQPDHLRPGLHRQLHRPLPDPRDPQTKSRRQLDIHPAKPDPLHL